MIMATYHNLFFAYDFECNSSFNTYSSNNFPYSLKDILKLMHVSDLPRSWILQCLEFL